MGYYKLIVIDVKWKILKSLAEISLDDLLKLKRDVEIRKCKNEKVIPFLIYPYIYSNNSPTKFIKITETICHNKFDFYIKEINLL